LNKGVQGTKAISLIYNHTCTAKCPVRHDCEFWKENKPCEPHAEYCASIFDAALDVCAETFNTKEGVRLGTMLLPMFSLLFKLKLEYAAAQQLIYRTDNGDVKVHPIVRELRSQIAATEKMWNNLGFKENLDLSKQPSFRGTDYVGALMGEDHD